MNTMPIVYVPPFEAHGSHGSITFDRITGRVFTASGCTCGDCGDGYRNVIQVDVAELRAFYAAHYPPSTLDKLTAFDVLEISWWQTAEPINGTAPDLWYRGGYAWAEQEIRLRTLNMVRDGFDPWDV